MKRLFWMLLCITLLFAWGCAKKQTSTVEDTEPVQQQTMEEPMEEPMEETTDEAVPVDEYGMLPTNHVVVKGECLWWIAEYKEVYNDPFMWPLIYKANRSQINNPDLIYPDQVFEIPRAFTLNDLQDSRQQAGAPRPYTPPMKANLPADIRYELGWGN